MAEQTVGHLLKTPAFVPSRRALLHRQSCPGGGRITGGYMLKLVPRGQRSVSVLSRTPLWENEHAAARSQPGLSLRDRFEIKRGGLRPPGEMEFEVDVREIILDGFVTQPEFGGDFLIRLSCK